MEVHHIRSAGWNGTSRQEAITVKFQTSKLIDLVTRISNEGCEM
jgi:hypothetical protein